MMKYARDPTSVCLNGAALRYGVSFADTAIATGRLLRAPLRLLAPKSRARARGRGADDGAGGAAPARRWCATAPRFNNCVAGAYGIARFAEREAVESDGHARSTCGVRELRDAPVRRSVRQRAAAARPPPSIVCWWQLGDAGGAEDRRRAPATTGHRAAACDQHDTRRHPATSLLMMLLLRPAGRAARFSYRVIGQWRH